MSENFKFEIGEIVRCVNGAVFSDSPKIGEIYVVEKFGYGDTLKLKDVDGEWYPRRFEKVRMVRLTFEDKVTVGETLECVEPYTSLDGESIQKGLYKVTQRKTHGGTIKVEGANGFWNLTRFARYMPAPRREKITAAQALDRLENKQTVFLENGDKAGFIVPNGIYYKPEQFKQGDKFVTHARFGGGSTTLIRDENNRLALLKENFEIHKSFYNMDWATLEKYVDKGNISPE